MGGVVTRPPLLVPWRPDGGRRDQLWEFCRPRWDGFDLIEIDPDAGPFNRAQAINRAAARTDADVFVVIDADVIIRVEQVEQAVALARQTARLMFAFDWYYALDEGNTEAVLTGKLDPWSVAAPRRISRYFTPRHESSVVVIPRQVWEATGGFDERFVGWGQEDVAFCQAARVLTGGPSRVLGPVFHLWHPRSSERDHRNPGWRANQALGRRYRMARTPEAIRALREGHETAHVRAHLQSQRLEWNGDQGRTRIDHGSNRKASR